METIRTAEINGKRFTFSFLSDEDKGLALNYTKGDESRKIDDIFLIKPHFISSNHPVWYEIATYDPDFKNHRILVRIQVDKI